MENKADDEIDLQELVVQIIRYFQRHFRFIILSTFLGTGIGTASWFLLPQVYGSQMILMSDILTELYGERMTQTLELLIKEHNDGILAAKLNLTVEEAEKIRLIDMASVKKSENEPTVYIVTVEFEGNKILTKLQEGIISFLRNNEFVKIRVAQREVYYKTLIAKLDEEISSLDSLKKKLFTGKSIYADRNEMLLVDPTSIYSKIIDLNKQRIEYINALELSNSIQLVEGFTLFKKPKSPKLLNLIIIGFGFGFATAIGILTLRHLNELAKMDGD